MVSASVSLRYLAALLLLYKSPTMKKNYGKIALLMAASALPLGAQVINGDFQQAGIGMCDAGATWNTSTGTLAPQYVVTGNNAWIDMTPCGGFGNGAFIEQQVSTTPGQVYHIAMDIATCFGWQIWDTGFDIDINGATLNGGATRVFYNAFDTSVPGAMKWTTAHSATFVATGSLTTVRIIGNGANPQNAAYQQPSPGPGVMGLDNVTLVQGSPVTSVPENFQAKYELVAYPNPATEEISVITPQGAPAGEFVIKDLSGRVLVTADSDAGNIKVSSLPPGVYLLQARSAQTLKLIISR